MKLLRETEARAEQRGADLEGLNALRMRAGQKEVAVPSVGELRGHAFFDLTELGLSAQARLCVPGDVLAWLPFWRSALSEIGRPQAFVTGTEHVSTSRSAADGTPITSGRDGTHVASEAAALIERVKARRAGTKVTVATVATAAASAVGLLAVLGSVFPR